VSTCAPQLNERDGSWASASALAQFHSRTLQNERNSRNTVRATPNYVAVTLMTIPSSASPTGARPYNAALLTSFALMAAAGAWFMRIYSFLNGAPVGFNDIIAAGEHPNGLRIKKHYTGLTALDEGLSFLVTAFIPGSAGWNEAWYWQQVHFLIQLTPIIAMMNVEACRGRNKGSWLKYTGAVACT
jgi:hypothetical protein